MGLRKAMIEYATKERGVGNGDISDTKNSMRRGMVVLQADSRNIVGLCGTLLECLEGNIQWIQMLVVHADWRHVESRLQYGYLARDISV